MNTSDPVRHLLCMNVRDYACPCPVTDMLVICSVTDRHITFCKVFEWPFKCLP